MRVRVRAHELALVPALAISFLQPISSVEAGPPQQDETDVRSSLVGFLDETEHALQQVPMDYVHISQLAMRVYNRAFVYATNLLSPTLHQASPFLMLAHLLLARAIKAPRRRDGDKLYYMRRVALLAQHGWYRTDHATLDSRREWLASLHVQARWPRANRLPTRALASLGCAHGNQSLVGLLTGNLGNGLAKECRQDLSALDVVWWRELWRRLTPPVSLFRALYPSLQVRPIWVGEAENNKLLQHILDDHITSQTGLFLQFGVHKGESVNIIGQHLRALGSGVVYGFDSFRGLPEAWPGATQTHGGLPSGYFSLNELPVVEPNVKLVVGYFNETLPDFVREHSAARSDSDNNGSSVIQLLHLDADLYSSTANVLTELRPFIGSGCIIVIDDFINYPGFQNDGMKALEDFLVRATGVRRLEVLGAPYQIHLDLEGTVKDGAPTGAYGDAFFSRQDVERAVALRVA